MADAAQRCRYTAAWRSHVLAHLPFYFCLLPMYLDLVTHTASVAAQQAAKHLRRVGRVRLRPCPCWPSYCCASAGSGCKYLLHEGFAHSLCLYSNMHTSVSTRARTGPQFVGVM